MALCARNTPRARATDVDQATNVRLGVRAGSLRASEPRARETAPETREELPECVENHAYT